MSGSRMAKAIEILKAFLDAIPPQSLFNVYSFGSSFTSLYRGL